ncbi:hypothetical protein Aduo_008615 [Ancylostoma duodenale]
MSDPTPATKASDTSAGGALSSSAATADDSPAEPESMDRSSTLVPPLIPLETSHSCGISIVTFSRITTSPGSNVKPDTQSSPTISSTIPCSTTYSANPCPVVWSDPNDWAPAKNIPLAAQQPSTSGSVSRTQSAQQNQKPLTPKNLFVPANVPKLFHASRPPPPDVGLPSSSKNDSRAAKRKHSSSWCRRSVSCKRPNIDVQVEARKARPRAVPPAPPPEAPPCALSSSRKHWTADCQTYKLLSARRRRRVTQALLELCQVPPQCLHKKARMRDLRRQRAPSDLLHQQPVADCRHRLLSGAVETYLHANPCRSHGATTTFLRIPP